MEGEIGKVPPQILRAGDVFTADMFFQCFCHLSIALHCVRSLSVQSVHGFSESLRSIAEIPPELLALIFRQLLFFDINRCLRVCTAWHMIIDSDWKTLSA